MGFSLEMMSGDRYLPSYKICFCYAFLSSIGVMPKWSLT